MRLLTSGDEHRLADSPLFVKNTLESFPQEEFLADSRLVTLRANALIQLGDLAGAYRVYREVLAQKAPGAADGIAGYRRMAETFAQRKEYAQAINQLRSALNLIGQEANASDTYQKTTCKKLRGLTWPRLPLPESGATAPRRGLRSWHALLGSSSTSKWFGAMFGLGCRRLSLVRPTRHRFG